MEKKVLPKSVFEGVEDPQFESNWDYCLITPIDDNLEMTYFNMTEKNVVMLKQSTNELTVNPRMSVLFCLNKQAEIMQPNLGCPVATKN